MELQYVPLALPFFLLFFGLFIFLLILIQLHVLHFAYAKLGLSSGAALLVLLASLIGSYFNIPLAELPEREVRSGEVIEFFGMRYVVPLVTDWPRTVIAVNIGGAVIPTLLSIYLLIKNDILSSAAVATAVVMVACYLLAQPVPGVGIAIPSLVPPIIAATTLQLSSSHKGMWRRSPMSAEAWVRSLARIYSILARFRDWEPRLCQSEELALLTVFF